MEISQELQITFNEQKVFFEKKPASFTYLAFIIAFIFSFPMKIFRLLKSFKNHFTWVSSCLTTPQIKSFQINQSSGDGRVFNNRLYDL